MKKTLVISTLFFASLCLHSQSLSKVQSQRLLSFSRLYSTVMYYYPEPNLRDFPWTFLAFRGYQLAKNATNDEEFIQKTDSLFHIIAPGVQISREGFDLARITPKDTARYAERAFWQHQAGLNIDRTLFANASTLNYIYKKPVDEYSMSYTLSSKDLQGKDLRISLWAKVESREDSVRVFIYKFSNRKTGKNTYIDIKAAGNEWQRYEKEFRHADENASPIIDVLRLLHLDENTFPVDELRLFHPRRGTVYVDSLKLEVKNGEAWEKIVIANSNFETYTPFGTLRDWKTMYIGGALAFADSINALNGKYCLKLPVVQDRLLYAPAPLDKPHSVLLRGGYQAYIPLQLYANTATVFPLTNRQAIKNLSKELQKDSLTANQSFIAYALQTWAALYHDYPYRDAGFENRLNRLLLQTIERLETDTATLPYTILRQGFLTWINDPHLDLGGRISKGELANRNRIDLPVKMPDAIVLTETQCVVNNVADSITSLQAGDVILKINDINIDRLLHLYRTNNISRHIQKYELLKLMTTFGKPEMRVQLLRNGQKKNVVFTDNQQQKSSIKLQAAREKYQVIQDSLKATRAVFYLNAMYPPDSIFNRNVVQTRERFINQYHATDSLIAELNQYKALILDVRGRPQNTSIGILFFLTQYMDIDVDRNSDVLKTAFLPVAQFKRDTLRLDLLYRRKGIIQVPVYVLIDEKNVSAPERELIALRESGRATFIGSNTAGAAGPVCRQQIADNVRLIYTTGQTVGLDNNPMSYQGTGIPPDIYVYPTPKGIAEGRDEVLEKAVEIALENRTDKK